MMERRQKRSQDQGEAIQFLLEALADRSAAQAVALVTAQGQLLAGVGMPRDLRGLASLAGPIGRGEEHPDLEAIAGETDVFSRPVEVGKQSAYIAALGTRLRRFQDTVDGLGRICR